MFYLVNAIFFVHQNGIGLRLKELRSAPVDLIENYLILRSRLVNSYVNNSIQASGLAVPKGLASIFAWGPVSVLLAPVTLQEF